MAVLNRNCLVLRGVPVASDVVTVLERVAFNPAIARTFGLSYPRHLSTWTPSTDTVSRPCHEHVVSDDVGRKARRAGRPGGPAGVPERRPSRFAGRTIPPGWFQARGVVAPAALCLDLKVKQTAGERLPGRYSQALSRWAIPAGSLTRLPAGSWPSTRGQALAAGAMPAGRMPRT